jgi:hypothetical protein
MSFAVFTQNLDMVLIDGCASVLPVLQLMTSPPLARLLHSRSLCLMVRSSGCCHAYALPTLQAAMTAMQHSAVAAPAAVHPALHL